MLLMLLFIVGASIPLDYCKMQFAGISSAGLPQHISSQGQASTPRNTVVTYMAGCFATSHLGVTGCSVEAQLH